MKMAPKASASSDFEVHRWIVWLANGFELTLTPWVDDPYSVSIDWMEDVAKKACESGIDGHLISWAVTGHQDSRLHLNPGQHVYMPAESILFIAVSPWEPARGR